jgi:hypothetical protein
MSLSVLELRAARVYHERLSRDGDARAAFALGVYVLSGQRLNHLTSPADLVARARDLSVNLRRSDELNLALRRGVSMLTARLEHDLKLWITWRYCSPYIRRDEQECVRWGEYTRENRGDLECEAALSLLWSGRAWAPLGRSMMLSLSPLLPVSEPDDEPDQEITDHEADELAMWRADLRRELAQG